MVSGQQGFLVNEPIGDDGRILAHILSQYYFDDHAVPREILLPFTPDDRELLMERFSDLKKGNVVLHVPQRGNLKKLINMAQKNGEQILADRQKKFESWQDLSAILQSTLRLSKSPERIECLDISNIGGEKAVGALVSFFNGEKDSKKYRHYKIKTLEGPDDYGMMAEVLKRHLKRKKEENNLPDLLMVDGGKGQLNVAVNVLASLDLSTRIDLVGIAKEKKREGEKLYRPGRKNPILLPGHSPLLLFLMRVRDESHHYGITFHRKWRRRETLHSELDQIPGIGRGRKEILLAKLGSLKRIKEASLTELADVKGIGPELARQIRAYFDD
jgi:excinuclease ABC subunit C